MNDEIMDDSAEKEKTFTQNEVNKIVSDRVSREKAHYEMKLMEHVKEIKRRERVYSISAELATRGISGSELAESWCDLPEETIAKNIKILDAAISEGVERGIDERLKSSQPPKAATASPDPEADIRQAMGLK